MPFVGKARADEGQAPKVYVRPQVEYKSIDLADPFRYPETENSKQQGEKISARPLPGMGVQGIIWGGNFPQAIVNNKVVKVGDAIEGACITDIQKDGITVLFDNQQYTIYAPSAARPQSTTGKP